MNKEDINELLEYNNEYMEAQISEEIFGGDYTSAVELEYVKKENQRLQQELERYKNIVDDIEKYIHYYKIEDIGEKTMLILNDILLIKNGMANEVVRLKELKGE